MARLTKTFSYSAQKIGALLGKNFGKPGLGWDRAVSMDIDGDGDREIVIASALDSSVGRKKPQPLVVLDFRKGQLEDVTKKTLSKPVANVLTRELLVADFNGDGIDDLFIGNHGTESVNPFPGEKNRLLYSDGKGGLVVKSGLLPKITDFTHGSSVADFDGDGDIDIFVNNLGEDDGHPSYLLINKGGGKFTRPLWSKDNFNTFGNEQSDRFANNLNKYWLGYFTAPIDVGNDGTMDIYMGPLRGGGGTPNRWGYLENDGAANFRLTFDSAFKGPGPKRDQFNDRLWPELAKSGDLDNDGDVDAVIFWAPRFGKKKVKFQLLDNQGAKGFVDVSDRIPGQKDGKFLPDAAGAPDFQLVDFDADGDLDIALHRWTTNFDGPVIYWFLNNGSGKFSKIKPAKVPGTQSFEIADINGDWLPDIVYQLFSGKIAFRLGELPKAVKRKGWATDDKIAGGKFNDKLSGLRGDDSLNGNGGRDTIVGAKGDDRLFGRNGPDVLIGGRGDDTISGGKQNDRLKGGPGKDVMIGGPGTDRFIFRKRDGEDSVKDFRNNTDKIVLDGKLWGGGLSAKQLVKRFAKDTGSDVLLDFGNGDILRIEDVTSPGALVNDIILI